jgi:hypothetical protein
MTERNKIIFTATIFLGAIMMLCTIGKSADVTLHWTAPGDDGNVGQAQRYDARMSLNRSQIDTPLLCDTVPAMPAPAPAGLCQQITIHNLLPDTVYYFAIRTVDDAGLWSGWSNIPAVRTPDTTPPAPIIIQVGPCP